MAFGMNRAELIGRLGADVTVNHLTSEGRVANLPVMNSAYGVTQAHRMTIKSNNQ